MKRVVRRACALMLTCEHGGCEVPAALAPVFVKAARLLRSHRGWDRGAVELARRLARVTGAPLHAAGVSRLVVDLNRSRHHPNLLSPMTAALPPDARRRLIERHYVPHRRAVVAAVRRAVPAVVHVAVHSFTPRLRGKVRRVDIGLLYDPRRRLEVAFCDAFAAAFGRLQPRLRLRRNQPYRGTSDGLTTALRRCFADGRYGGVELEVNQRLVTGAGWVALQGVLVHSVLAAMEDLNRKNF